MARPLTRRFAAAVAARLTRYATGPHTETREAAAVRAACEQAGLPMHLYGRDYNLAEAGKLDVVLRLAGRRLGVDTEFDTVGDVIDWLESP